MPLTLKFQDEEGRAIEVGTPVRFYFGPSGSKLATVVALGEPGHDYPDVDFDDELGRPVEYAPKISIRFADGSEEKVNTWNVTRVTWADYPDGPQELLYEAGDVEVVV